MKYKSALLLISAVILFTACSGKREGLELADASAAANNAKTELAELKSENPYRDKNIDFSGAIDFLPENVGDMYVLRKSKDGKEFSQAEMYDMFIESVNREFPNSEHAKDKNNYIFSSEKCDSPHWDENKELKYLCLYESDYLQRIKDEAIDDVGFFAYTTYETNRSHDSKQEFLLMSDDCYMVQLRHSDTWQKVEFDMSFESWVPLWTLNIKAYATPDDEKEHTLSGGESVTVKDAVKMCEDYFTNSYFNINKAMHFKVVCVYILEVDENTESFYYYLTPEYNGIPMDYVLTNGSFSEYSDGNHYDSEYNSAFMSRAGEIERFDCVFNRVITPIGDKAEGIISLKKAAEILSEELSDEVMFEAGDVTLVYAQKFTDEKDVRECRPSWRINLYNTDDDQTYVCYVDALDGHMFYYIIRSENR